MRNSCAVYGLLLILFYLNACQTSKKPKEVPAAKVEEKDLRAVAPGTFENGFELIWKDDADNNSTSLYPVNAESMVFGEDMLYYITGPKEPEGGSFSQVKALDLKNRKLKWSRKFVTHQFTKIDIANDLIIFTGQQGFGDMFDGISYVVALRASTGELAWKTKIEEQPYGGGVFDMAVHNGLVYLLREREQAGEGRDFELQTINLKTGEPVNTFKLDRDFSTDVGMYEGPVFLTMPNPETFKKELIMPNGNLIILGKEKVERIAQNVSHIRYAEAIVAVSPQTGKVAWHYIDPLENLSSIAGWQVSGNAVVVHFSKPLNTAGHTGFDLLSGKEVAANSSDITVNYDFRRQKAGGYQDHYIDVLQKRAAYKIKYQDENVMVFEKVRN